MLFGAKVGYFPFAIGFDDFWIARQDLGVLNGCGRNAERISERHFEIGLDCSGDHCNILIDRHELRKRTQGVDRALC